ncbi:MAG: type-F conjugative transfer system secretin TraK [Alphaproteobacteria bacterium]|nr:type-F conjugative transfer system secretin TraK [Alphaproteobacteria bacterium]
MMNRFTLNKFMMNKLAILLLTGSAVQAAVVRPLDEMKVLEISIAQDALTRIKVQDDRILQVFGNAGEYVLETDDYQGQIFIRPMPSLEAVSSKTISLTLTTEAGYTQDLHLLPKKQVPEALILQINTDPNKNEKLASTPLLREEVEDLILALKEERIPLGYKEMPINLIPLNEPYQRMREIQGQKLRGLTYRIQNNTKEPLILHEAELANSLNLNRPLNALVALLIPKKTLTSGEGVDLYVVARAH